MRCETCGGASFEVSAEASAEEDGIYIWSQVLSRVNVEVSISISCKRCRQRYGGRLKSRALISIKKLERAPFPASVIAVCREEFATGWELRHTGHVFREDASLVPAIAAGWTAAADWAKDKKGRPPVRLGWKEVVNAYLETEPAWEYMKTLVTQQAFKE